MNDVVEVMVSKVIIPDGRRQTTGVAEIADSIAQNGLINPITIRGDGRLIAGMRRLSAFKLLERLTIPAIIADVETDEDAELLEIDENLERQELKGMELSEALARRKVLYLLKHPQTRHGGDRKSEAAREGKNQDAIIASWSETPAPFVAETAAKMKKARNYVSQIVGIDKIVPEAKAIVEGTRIATETGTLIILSHEPAERQVEAAKQLVAGEITGQAMKDRRQAEKRAAKTAKNGGPGAVVNQKTAKPTRQRTPSSEEEAAKESAAKTNAIVRSHREELAANPLPVREVTPEVVAAERQSWLIADGIRLAGDNNPADLYTIIRSALWACGIDVRDNIIERLCKEARDD